MIKFKQITPIIFVLILSMAGVLFLFFTLAAYQPAPFLAYPGAPEWIAPQPYPAPQPTAYNVSNTSSLPPTWIGNYTFYLPLLAENANQKKGLAWGDYGATAQADYELFQVGWYHLYRYWDNPSYPHAVGLDYVRDWGCINVGPSISAVVNTLGSDFDDYLLWVNEPTMPDQCYELNDVHLAAQHYITTAHYLPDAKIIGPRMFIDSLGQYLIIVDWLSRWRQRVFDLTCGNVVTYTNPFPDVPCGYPNITGYALHTYDNTVLPNNGNLKRVDDFYDQMIAWGDGDKELWIDEFGYCKHYGENAGLWTTQYVMGLEARPFVTRYAYWSIRGRVYNVEAEENIPEACLNTHLFEADLVTLTYAGEAYRAAGNP